MWFTKVYFYVANCTACCLDRCLQGSVIILYNHLLRHPGKVCCSIVSLITRYAVCIACRYYDNSVCLFVCLCVTRVSVLLLNGTSAQKGYLVPFKVYMMDRI